MIRLSRLPARPTATLLAAFSCLPSLGSAAPARADVPAVYEVCATVPWKPPSLVAQRRHLATNPRWSPGDRSDPLPALRFPFIIRIRSASISGDQSALGGLWTLGKRAATRIGRCPSPGGLRHNYELLLKGWEFDHVDLSDSGDLVAYGHPDPGHLQDLHFPGYGNPLGMVERQVTLERTDAPGCAISAIDNGHAVYDELLSTGVACGEMRQLVADLDDANSWRGPVDGFTCARGVRGYNGNHVNCVDATGRTVRFGYQEPR
jgi:hypothetical protein